MEDEELVELKLQYKNGAAALKPPVFTDVYLNRDSQAGLELVLEEGKKQDRVIRNEGQLAQCVKAHRAVDEALKQLGKLEVAERHPWVRVLSQIGAAVVPMRNQLQMLSRALRSRVSEWRQKVVEGAEAESERLRALAEEKQNEAKYAEDPKRARAAAVAAKQLEKAAREALPKPAKGLATEVYYEIEIVSRTLAAKLPQEAVEMTPNEVWFNKEIRRRQKAGERIHFDGINLIKKTRPKFYR